MEVNLFYPQYQFHVLFHQHNKKKIILFNLMHPLDARDFQSGVRDLNQKWG